MFGTQRLLAQCASVRLASGYRCVTRTASNAQRVRLFSGPAPRNFFSFRNGPKYNKPSKSWNDYHSNFKGERKTLMYYNFGIYAAVFGMCFAMVPLYRIFCEHVGLSGNFDQKDYSMKGKNVFKHRKFNLHFTGIADPSVDWEFEPVQTEIIVNAGETALTFYRAYNAEPNAVIGFATYNVYPEEAMPYFSKVQCFCFNQQLLNPKEELQLPLYFYLEPEIVDDPVLQSVKDIKISYSFIKCKKQDMVRHVEDELERVRRNKEFIKALREKKKQ